MPTTRGIRGIVIGADGSAPARHAVKFVARLAPPRGGWVRCVSVLEPTRVPSMPLVPASFRATVSGEARALDQARSAVARRAVDAAVAELERAGWRASGEVRYGVPLATLLSVVRATDADTLALGAKGTTGAARILLGSVAEGALRQAPVTVAVLIVP
jgi:nucleotide-binding universal stress UspA family protein